ncbi:MAG: helix-turn-helix transcriptional regulator [Chloroflexi bacterium]|nr:helix-turn-helix transcriptional regulator [Chloroflexota bacterium]MYF64906.1 helix-turn-helix transcriptional regulator [Chloroflexota bacterium]MYK35261.1 helix-turn-helix transcriptional regulator [Chloroflexota bacterium]
MQHMVLHGETGMNEQSDRGEEHIGQTLKRLRGETSIRAVQRLTGVSNAYLSQIEKGTRHPGPRLLRRLAALYGVSVHDLLRKAGYLDREDEEPQADEEAEVERAYQFVLADPVFRVGTRPRGPLSTESKRFIVELYERYSGKRLLP